MGTGRGECVEEIPDRGGGGCRDISGNKSAAAGPHDAPSCIGDGFGYARGGRHLSSAMTWESGPVVIFRSYFLSSNPGRGNCMNKISATVL